MRKKTEKKREILASRPPGGASWLSLVTKEEPDVKAKLIHLFKDLQGDLALTIRKIYESYDSASDEEKCDQAALFVTEALEHFERMDHTVLSLAESLDRMGHQKSGAGDDSVDGGEVWSLVGVGTNGPVKRGEWWVNSFVQTVELVEVVASTLDFFGAFAGICRMYNHRTSMQVVNM